MTKQKRDRRRWKVVKRFSVFHKKEMFYVKFSGALIGSPFAKKEDAENWITGGEK